MTNLTHMVRPRSPDFMPRLLHAAARVFARHGLKRTRMADIARDMGVAHGSLYNYVESKEALFLLLVERWGHLDSDLADRELPLKTPSMQSIVNRLKQRVVDTFPLPALDAALARRRPSDPGRELEGVVRELFVRTEESREGATILERSALDVPELYHLFFEQVRRGLFDRMTRYVAARMRDGDFQKGDPVVAARFIIETVTFFARHRHLDPEPQRLDDETVRNSIVALVTRSLAPAAGSKSPGRPRRLTKRADRRRRS
jgi:AcrR family transcriptional regulator